MAESAQASQQPSQNSTAASIHQFGANAAANGTAAVSSPLPTAVRALPNRAMRGPASMPVSRAPSGIAAMAVPKAALDSSSEPLMAGNQGTTLA